MRFKKNLRPISGKNSRPILGKKLKANFGQKTQPFTGNYITDCVNKKLKKFQITVTVFIWVALVINYFSILGKQIVISGGFMLYL